MILVSEKTILYITFKFKINSNEIADFSLKELKEINTCLEDNTFICFKKDTLIRVNNQSYIEPKKVEILLFKIRKNKNTNNYILENPIPIKISEDNSNSLNIKLWFILNHEKSDNNNDNDMINIINDDYFLREKDIVKFGNIKYIIQEINIRATRKVNIINEINDKSNNNNNNANTENSEGNTESKPDTQERQETQDIYDINSINENSADIFAFLPTPKEYYIETITDKDNIICYICNLKKCSEKNPLIKFCGCNFVHFYCLKEIIKQKAKIIDEGNNVKNYYLRGLNCKKCHTIYPLKFKISNNTYEFYEIEKPTDSDYMIMESIEHKIFFGQLKLIHVIKLNENTTIKIGRKEKDNDMVICDPSISRWHAIIKYDKENRKILIKNISKKYGTLILLKKSLKINEKNIQIQIGKVFIEARTMKFGEFQKIKNKNTKYPLTKKD